MKTFIISACCMTIISLSTAFAQSSSITKKDSVESQTPYESKSNHLLQNDMVLVNNADIPEALKQTLKKDKFKGWQSGRMFNSPNDEIYVLEIETPGKQVKVYKFDENGQPVKGD